MNMAASEVALSPKRRVLLLTNVEAGQSNVIVAVGHELHVRGADVHFAALPGFKRILDKALPEITFHPLSGPDLKTIWMSEPALNTEATRTMSTNLLKMWFDIRAALTSVFPWSGPQYVELYNSVLNVISTVKPDICVVDPALNPALTAMLAIKQPFVILAPNTIKDFAIHAQPLWHQFAKFPCLASGFPYPVPWYLVFYNIIYTSLGFLMGLFNYRQWEIAKYIKEHTGADVFDYRDFHTQQPRVSGVKILVANREEIEFPLQVMPKHIIPCGPIIRPTPLLADSDIDLNLWLNQGPTIYINLGTHVYWDQDLVIAMTHALSRILENADTDTYKSIHALQILWKLNCAGITDALIYTKLGKYIDSRRVRITEWLDSEPASVVRHRNIAVSVSHGGANSFLEAITAGKPQIILPAWMDCFDFASRVEILGIGVWGNKNTIGRFKAADLYDAFKEVLVGPRSTKIQEKAMMLAELFRREPGREKAASVILNEIDGTLEA